MILLLVRKLLFSSLGGQALLLCNLCLDALYLCKDKLFKGISRHTCPSFLEDKFEYRVVEQALGLASHCVKHTLTLVLSNDLIKSLWRDEKLQRLADFTQYVVEQVVV